MKLLLWLIWWYVSTFLLYHLNSLTHHLRIGFYHELFLIKFFFDVAINIALLLWLYYFLVFEWLFGTTFTKFNFFSFYLILFLNPRFLFWRFIFNKVIYLRGMVLYFLFVFYDTNVFVVFVITHNLRITYFFHSFIFLIQITLRFYYLFWILLYLYLTLRL